jgi:DNA-binding transcriptional ArsR family regulator
MESVDATIALASLAQVTRLDVFRLLVRHEPNGLRAGEIAQKLGVPANTMSTHLAVLTRSGLASSVRHSRTIVYRANIDALRNLIIFLANDCCGGSQEFCRPLIEELVCS